MTQFDWPEPTSGEPNAVPDPGPAARAASVINLVFLRLFGTLSAITVILVNGMSPTIAIPVLVVAASTDAFRFARRNAPPSRNRLLTGITGDAFNIGALIAITVAYSVSWFFAADWCWPGLNGFIEAHSSLPAQALAPLGPPCNIPRGSYQLFTQATLPLLILIVILNSVLGSALDSKKYITRGRRLQEGNIEINKFRSIGGPAAYFVTLFLPLATYRHGSEGRFGIFAPNLSFFLYFLEIIAIYILLPILLGRLTLSQALERMKNGRKSEG